MRLRLLSYNIQTGLDTKTYLEYVTQGWRHVLPTRRRQKNLDNIASMLPDFDVVALQEVDCGSLRSGFINQVEYLAELSDFPYWHHQLNRNLGKVAQFGNGVLSKIKPSMIIDHKLPGFVPGRGAIGVQFGEGEDALVIVVMHLALGDRSRRKQVAYIADYVRSFKHIILVGDMNCTFHRLMKLPILNSLDLYPVHHDNTFPSWRPMRSIDHILVTPSIRINHVRVLKHHGSDHLPIAVDLTLPTALDIPA